MMHIATHTFIEMLKKITKTRKALIIGSGGVGKTTLLNALEKHQLLSGNVEYKRTAFINFGTLSVLDSQGTTIKIHFQDLAGQLNLPIHALKDVSHIDQNFVNDYLKSNTFINQYFETNCVTGAGLDQIVSFLSKEVV